MHPFLVVTTMLLHLPRLRSQSNHSADIVTVEPYLPPELPDGVPESGWPRDSQFLVVRNAPWENEPAIYEGVMYCHHHFGNDSFAGCVVDLKHIRSDQIRSVLCVCVNPVARLRALPCK